MGKKPVALWAWSWCNQLYGSANHEKGERKRKKGLFERKKTNRGVCLDRGVTKWVFVRKKQNKKGGVTRNKKGVARENSI